MSSKTPLRNSTALFSYLISKQYLRVYFVWCHNKTRIWHFFPFNFNHTLLCYGILFINTIPFIQPHVTNIILFLYNFFSLAVENSPESSYVPGSFSAKGRSKLRSPNSVTPVAPANLDKAINQVCVLYINKLKIMNKKVIILKNEKKSNFPDFRFLIGWIWIKIWLKTTTLMLVTSKRLQTPLLNKKLVFFSHWKISFHRFDL